MTAVRIAGKTIKSLLAALAAGVLVSGCTAISLAGAVVGTTVSVATTAVDVGVTVGTTAVSATTKVVKAAVPGD